MDHLSNPPVSIVTPVYNEEDFIAECIESVLSQTYQNWDYTIVDNCSTDRTFEIASRYAAKNPRIRIVRNKEFLNIIANFNNAVEQISPSSKYCKVVLADDLIFPECIERMVALAEEHPSVGVVSARRLFGEEVQFLEWPYAENWADGRKVGEQFLLKRFCVFGTANSVLYRADLVRGRKPFYKASEMNSDHEVCCAILKASDFGFVPQVLTLSRPREGSTDTVSLDLGARFRSQLHMLVRYGEAFLGADELRKSLAEHLEDYYTFLSRRLMVERDDAFWSFHREAFAEVGLHFSRRRVAGALISQLWSAVLNPNSVTGSLKRYLSLRRIRNSDTRKAFYEVALASESDEPKQLRASVDPQRGSEPATGLSTGPRGEA